MNNLTNKVQFKKERDLGAIISDAFTFLREQWKPFFTTVFKISLFPILIFIISISVMYYFFTDFMSLAVLGGDMGDYNYDLENNIGLMFGAILVLSIFYLIAYTVVTLSSMYFIKSYVDNEEFSLRSIQEKVQDKFWSFIGLSILNVLIIFVGMLFCFLPGIYLGITLALTTPLLVFENRGATDAIDKAFSFIKGHWWETFGIMLVVMILIGVLNGISQAPLMIYSLIKMGTSSFLSEDPNQMFSIYRDPIYIGLTAFSYVVRFFFYVISLITTSFIYFDINEQKNASGSMEMIDSIGK